MRITRFAIRLLTTLALVVMAVCVARFPTARRPNPEVRIETSPSPAESTAPTPKPIQEMYGVDPARMILYHQKELRTPEEKRRMREWEMMERMRKTLEAVPDKPERIR